MPVQPDPAPVIACFPLVYLRNRRLKRSANGTPMNGASSLARNSAVAATSSGVPRRLHGARGVPGALQVDGEAAFPVLVAQGQRIAEHVHAGVVDQGTTPANRALRV